MAITHWLYAVLAIGQVVHGTPAPITGTAPTSSPTRGFASGMGFGSGDNDCFEPVVTSFVAAVTDQAVQDACHDFFSGKDMLTTFCTCASYSHTNPLFCTIGGHSWEWYDLMFGCNALAPGFDYDTFAASHRGRGIGSGSGVYWGSGVGDCARSDIVQAVDSITDLSTRALCHDLLSKSSRVNDWCGCLSDPVWSSFNSCTIVGQPIGFFYEVVGGCTRAPTLAPVKPPGCAGPGPYPCDSYTNNLDSVKRCLEPAQLPWEYVFEDRTHMMFDSRHPGVLDGTWTYLRVNINGCPNVSLDAPAKGRVCCANHYGAQPSNPGPDWNMFSAGQPIFGHAGTPCDWYEADLAAGDHNICCSTTWGTGLFLQHTVYSPCAFGKGPAKGGCNDDSDCKSGLVCGNDNGADFGGNPSDDMCIFGPDYFGQECYKLNKRRAGFDLGTKQGRDVMRKTCNAIPGCEVDNQASIRQNKRKGPKCVLTKCNSVTSRQACDDIKRCMRSSDKKGNFKCVNKRKGL